MGRDERQDASEVIGFNRRQRNKMAVIKEGQEVHEVIVQEGVHTFESPHDAVAEAGGAADRPLRGRRVQYTGRGPDENLNAPGMHFEPLAFDTPVFAARLRRRTRLCPPNRFYAYGVVARLALLAGLEIEQTAPPRSGLRPEPSMKSAFILDPLDSLKIYRIPPSP